MAKKSRRRAKRGTTVPMAVVAGVAVALMTPVKTAISGDFDKAAAQLSTRFTGFDPETSTWKLGRLKNGLLPILIGAAGHKVAGKLGINRAIASTGIPWLRI